MTLPDAQTRGTRLVSRCNPQRLEPPRPRSTTKVLGSQAFPSCTFVALVVNGFALQTRRRTVLASLRLYNRGVDPLRHFDNSSQIRLTFALRRARILGAQQPRSDPQSIHFFADPQQLLLFHSQYVVRVFHWGRASLTNSDLVRLSRNTVSQFRAPGKLPEVHRG